MTTQTKTRPEMGQRVRITGKAKQIRGYQREKINSVAPWGSRTGYPRQWIRDDFDISQEGIYIGYRTIFDGYIWWENDEVGNVFAPSDHHEVWLVVINPRHNPIRVFPEDVEILAEG